MKSATVHVYNSDGVWQGSVAILYDDDAHKAEQVRIILRALKGDHTKVILES